MLGIAAGILFGVSDVAIKALTGSVGDLGVAGLLSPWLVTCVLASVIAFFASARGLQKGEAVPVITLTSAAANVTAISGGILVFGDPMPNDPLGIVLQSFAFVLVIVAAALTPAPLRAARGRGLARRQRRRCYHHAPHAKHQPARPQGPHQAQEEGLDARPQVRPGAQEAHRGPAAARRLHARLHHHARRSRTRRCARSRASG